MTFEQMSFETYLQQSKGFTFSTASNYERQVKGFCVYLENEGNTFDKLTYTDLLAFIVYRQQQAHSKGYINQQLSAIKYYLDFLVEKQILPCNVASGLFMRGRKKTLPSGLLSKEEMLDLYQKYEVKPDRLYWVSLKHKVVLGLMVFEGLLPEEMQQLRVEDIDLIKGLIHIRASGRSESRTLKLAVEQLFYMQKYIEARLIEAHSVETLPAGESREGQVLFTVGIHNLLLNFWKKLHKINPQVKTAMQLKMSLITQMLKTEDLRQVQAFAGHRFVSSTERYETSHLQTLENELSKFHPLK